MSFTGIHPLALLLLLLPRRILLITIFSAFLNFTHRGIFKRTPLSRLKISSQDIDGVNSQAQATRAVLGSQRALFGDVQGKVKLLGKKFPIIRSLLAFEERGSSNEDRGEMSRSLVQPIGQKRLTNVAAVRLKKHGMRFEIACYPNTALSWRSGVEKDLDEVLQSHTVYSNVSKGVLAKSKDLVAAFGTDDQSKICLEILKKGELQVAGKERESLLSSQFRDIATTVMQKTYNPETQRPYTINMIEHLMREIHFAVDPNGSSKKQALELIHELQKHFPIKRCPLRIRVAVPEEEVPALLEKLNVWKATIISKEGSAGQLSVIFELEPGLYKDCHDFVMNNMHGRFEVLAHSLHVDGDTHVEQYNDYEDMPASLPKETRESVLELNDKLQKQTISFMSSSTEGQQQKQNKCSTCNVSFEDSKLFREHHKSEWHKHNMKRKTRQLPPLTREECMADMELGDSKSDLKDYSF